MHKSILCTVAAIAIALVSAPSAEAAKAGKKDKRAERAAAMMLGRFDRDGSGTLDEKESKHVQTLFSALKQLDTDKNGELSGSELAAAKIEAGKGRAGKGGKRKAAKGQ